MFEQPPTRRRGRAFARCAAAVSAAGVIAASLLTAIPATAAATDPPGSYAEKNIGSDRTAANFFYRIPALAHLGDGVVLAAWDGRPGSAADSPNPNSIVLRRSTDNGVTWSEITTIAAGFSGTNKYGYSDPSFVVDDEASKVFAFFVYSQDQGFWGGTWGNSPTDRNIMNAAVIESADGGLTWSDPRLITDVAKPAVGGSTPVAGDVKSMFASSGEGIQLKYGENAGRLIQQYAGIVQQADGSTAIQAYSVYSDDHGVTWEMGTPAGTRMDENKVVELSDGSVMLNTRDNAGGGFRRVAISTDGGETYGTVTQDRQLIDPTNNASITRLFPDAEQGSSDAAKLLFTNSGSQSSRSNGTARVSCDDGKTWPGMRVFQPGTSGYSTATALDDGQFGLLYESNYTNDMRFASFDEAWLNYVCAPLSATDTTVTPGATTQIEVTITNQEATTLSGGSVTFNAPTGWTTEAVAVPDIAPGESATVTVPITPAVSAAGTNRVYAVHTAADGRQSHYAVVLSAPSQGLVNLQITGSAPARDLTASPYEAGDVIAYTLTVKNTGTQQSASVPQSGSFDADFLPPTAPNCRYLSLASSASYTCTPKHTITEEEAARGWFTPTATFTATSTSNASLTKTVTFTGAPVMLKPTSEMTPTATIVPARTDTNRDLATEPYTVGEAVPFQFTVTNTSPFAITPAPTAGPFTPFVPEGPGNCRYRNLAVGASYTCTTAEHTVTAEDIERGYFVADTTWAIAATGVTTATVEVAGGEVDVIERAPALEASVVGSFVDADGDGYASTADSITVTRTLSNTGNVALTDIDSAESFAHAEALAAGAELTDSATVELTEADLAAGSITVAGFTATAVNGSRAVETGAADASVALTVRPAEPTAALSLKRLKLRTPSTDIVTERLVGRGDAVTLRDLPAGEWVFVSLNEAKVGLGWVFPAADGTASVTLPNGLRSGSHTLVTRSEQGGVIAHDAFRLHPRC